MLSADEKAAAGAAALDRAAVHGPDIVHPQWRLAIDKDTLSMDSSCQCIIGQIDGTYSQGRRVLATNFPDIFPEEHDLAGWVDLGFVCDYNRVDDESWDEFEARIEHEYRELDAAWKPLL